MRNPLHQRPALRDALVWALPAIVAGLALRVVLGIYQPYGYWGSDSESYFSFAFRLLNEGAISIPEKRRYIYPIVLLPITILPGSPLKWLILFQHATGLATIVPLAYVVRKVLAGWRWWIVPVTLVYAGMPVFIWFEHELLGEAFFFATFTWAFAAWVAWAGRLERGDRAEAVWWIFLACLALCVLTKPAGRFFWPGLMIGLVFVRSWRFLRWPQWTALGALLVASWTMGQGAQASRLLYTSAFPLTVLDSPLHADLKAEIAVQVTAARERLDYYYLEDREPKRFLSSGYEKGDYPAWQALKARGGDAIYDAMRDLALEAILAHPHLFLYIALQRTVAAMNWTEFDLDRFEPDYYPRKFREQYDDLLSDNGKKAPMLRKLLGLPRDSAVPPYPEVVAILKPAGTEPQAQWMMNYVETVSEPGRFVRDPVENGRPRKLWEMTPTLLGLWLIAGIVAAFFPRHLRHTLGTWLLVAIGYAIGVHLIGTFYARFFAAAWPPLLVALLVPLDLIYRMIKRVVFRS